MPVFDRTCVYETHYHLVFVTKYRRPIFTTDQQKHDMTQILKDIATESEWIIENIEIMPEHIHMMIHFPPKYSLSNVVKKFKGVSARRWFIMHPETKEMLWGGHLWSPSYFASTLGHVSKDIVFEYINNQVDKFNGGRPRRDSSRG